MKKSFVKLAMVILTLTASQHAFAYEPIVKCGVSDSAGSTEIDNMYVVRGGQYINQLVIRNKNILNYFISQQAIYSGELNQHGEFVLQNGLGGDNGFYLALNNRYFTLLPEGAGYRLKVQLIGDNRIDLVKTLADFYFEDCK